MARTGDVIGGYRLIREIGRGGNAVVLLARSDDPPQDVAVKVLKRSEADRLSRFRDEIRALKGASGVRGVMPLLADSLGTDGEEGPLWLVMPLAEPIRVALGDDAGARTVIGAILAIASTLADLAEVGVHHRDLKPDNLFSLAGAWTVGDFGLATYPEKDPLTEAGRRLGPIDYMAPEMRDEADTADPEPADVFALAKTLWVLLAKRDLPLPGPHRPDDAAYSIAAMYPDELVVRHLDRLLEKATRIDPSTRPSMAKFRDELHAMLTPGAATAPASVDDAIHRLAELTAADARVNEQHRDRHNAFWESVVRFRDNWFYPASSESVEKVPNSGDIAKTRAPSTAFDDPRHFMPAPSDLEKADGFSAAATLPTPAGHRLLLAYSMRLCQSDAVQIAVLAVASTATPAASRVLLFETAMAELDTAILDTSLAAVGEKLVSAVHPIMSGFAEWVESQSGSSTKRRSREDREAPHLHALRIRPSVVQLSHSRVVAVEVDLSDDSSGVGHPTQIRFRSPTGEQFRDATFGPDQLTSGELTSGTFRTVFDLGEHSETGEWAVEYAYLADAAGNTRRLGPRELATAEIPTVFTVES